MVLGTLVGIEEGSIGSADWARCCRFQSATATSVAVDVMGNPIDGLGELQGHRRAPCAEIQAAGVMDRQEVREPMQTGLKAIDAMIPIGRGQRQLIIGDRKTGKTAIAIDTIINQLANWKSGDPKKQVRCISVAIGQKGSTIAEVRGQLRKPERWNTPPSSTRRRPTLLVSHIAPYTGSAIGRKHWMYAAASTS